MSENACAVFEFRHSANDPDLPRDKMIRILKTYCKKWSFQIERGEQTGYVHFQGAFSLIKKKRKLTLANDIHAAFGIYLHHCEPVASNNLENFDVYSQKLDTRIEGPWTDITERDVYIPRQYRDIDLWPWQRMILYHHDAFEPRVINWVYDPEGNHGKSTIAAYMSLHCGAIDMPPINDALMLTQTLCDILSARECRTPRTIFIDLPRCASKERLYGMLTAIEQIKKGHVEDLRYSYKHWWFDSPNVWVFSNTDLPHSDLSADRWRRWVFNGNELVQEVPVITTNFQTIVHREDSN